MARSYLYFYRGDHVSVLAAYNLSPKQAGDGCEDLPSHDLTSWASRTESCGEGVRRPARVRDRDQYTGISVSRRMRPEDLDQMLRDDFLLAWLQHE